MESHDKKSGSKDAALLVSRPLRIAAAWSWRILVILALVAVTVWAIGPVREIVVAFFAALLLAVLLMPFVSMLRKKLRMHRTAAAAIGLIVGLLIVGGLVALVVDQLLRNLSNVVTQTTEGIGQVIDWISEGPLGIQSAQLQDVLSSFESDIYEMLRNNGQLLATEALTLASSAVSMLAATLIGVFCLFFFLRDGRGMWIWFVRMFPSTARNTVNEAGIRGWVTLGNYVRTQIQVAAIDAVGIGLGAVILGVPLAIPITVLVFFGSFIPIVGAFVSGAVAVFIALVNNGVTTAVIMLIVVLAVQQIEGNILQPWMMGSAVSLHPVAVVLSVSIGGIIAGIPGALFAVPLVAFVNVVALYTHGHDSLPGLAEDPNRPGGPPGTLDEQIAASYKNKGVAVVARSQSDPLATKSSTEAEPTA